MDPITGGVSLRNTCQILYCTVGVYHSPSRKRHNLLRPLSSCYLLSQRLQREQHPYTDPTYFLRCTNPTPEGDVIEIRSSVSLVSVESNDAPGGSARSVQKGGIFLDDKRSFSQSAVASNPLSDCTMVSCAVCRRLLSRTVTLTDPC